MTDFSLANQRELDMLSKAGYKLTPATLAHKITQGAWMPAKHLMYMSLKIARAIAKGSGRLIISVPPRHGKSELGSVHTPIWTLNKWPDKKIIISSYGADLSTDFSRRVRDTFEDPEANQYLDTRLRIDAKNVAKFLTTENGALYAVGIGGPITGRGGHVFILDDYIKNNIDAFSDTQRETAWNWLVSTAFSRREPGCTFIIIATRWHQDDIIGRLLYEFPGIFEYIRLPATAEDDDPLGRKEGEPLWAERYDAAELEEIKMLAGTYWWKAMYQQDPPASLNAADIAKNIKIISMDEVPHPTHLKFVRSWDLAGTEGAGDWTVGSKLAYHKGRNHWYILDLRRKQYSSGKVERLVQDTAIDDGVEIPIHIEQEGGSAGKGAIERYKRDVLSGFMVSSSHPTGPIEARVAPFLALCESGNVSMVAAPWNKDVTNEIESFPGKHDDILASLSQGYDKLMKGRFGSPVWGRTSSGLYVPRGLSGDKRKTVSKGVVW